MLKTWFEPAVWFHGDQSIITSSSARNGNACRFICWLLHSIRCVLITPFGNPVEPDVNRIFATVSASTAALAVSTVAVGTVARKPANDSQGRVASVPSETTMPASGATASLANARSKRAASRA